MGKGKQEELCNITVFYHIGINFLTVSKISIYIYPFLKYIEDIISAQRKQTTLYI